MISDYLWSMVRICAGLSFVMVPSVIGFLPTSLSAAAPVGQPGIVAIAAATTQPAQQVPLNKSIIVSLHDPAKSVSIGNPGIADILVMHNRELYVVGKMLGSTNVVVWGADGRVSTSFIVEVTHDLDGLKRKLHELMPDEAIKVQSAEERLVLSGSVSSLARMDAVREVAMGFLPDCIDPASDAMAQAAADNKQTVQQSKAQSSVCDKASIVNLMQVAGAQQVMLKITVAEMSRSVVKHLNSDLNIFNFGSKLSSGAVSGGGSFPNALDPNGLLTPVQGSLNGAAPVIGPPVAMFQPNTPTIDGTGVFLNYLRGNFLLNAVLDVSKRNGLAKILSEPTLTTLTGQEAQFISGGEFPVPVPQANNSTTIEFKEYGVGVHFLPMVLDSGRINLNLNVTVSELSADNNVALKNGTSSTSFVIPSLTKRSASSSVELADGQTIGIAGLINDNVREFVSKLPGLGDLPLLGALFRSQDFQSGQTELVIFVTPHLARPIAAKDIRLPTDGFVPAGDLEFYLLGRLDHGGKPRSPSTTAPAAPRDLAPPASFGHDL